MKCTFRIFVGAFFQDEIDIVGFRRPDAEMRLVWAD